MSAYLSLHLVGRLHWSFWWFPLQYIDLSFVSVWPLHKFHVVTILLACLIFFTLCSAETEVHLCVTYGLVVGLTSCIGAGHIVFFAGIDSTGNQVTCWTSTFAFLMLPFLCLFIYLFILSYPPSFWFKDRLIYRVILFSWLFVSFCLHSFYVCCNFPFFFFNSRSVFFGLCIFLFFGLLFWQIPFAGQIITF